MIDQNFSRLSKEIEYYFSNPTAKRALVLHSEWGSGKSHLIRRWLQHYKDNLDYAPGMTRRRNMDIAYMSAFGVSSAEDLHERAVAAFIELDPKQKYFRGSNILIRLLRSYKSLDFPQLSNSSILKFLSKPKAIIIDDVERVHAPLNVAFGAINEFIESHNVKVVLICDKSKLAGRRNFNYIEKIADTVLPFPTDFEKTATSIVESFLQDMDEKYRFNEKIHLAVKHSRTKNLRSIEKSLGTLRRLISVIDQSNISNNEKLGYLVYAIAAYCLDHYDGHIKPDSISGIGGIFSSRGSEDSPLSVMKKYTLFDITNSYTVTLSPTLVQSIVFDNCVDANSILEELSGSHHFSDKRPDEWELIWHMNRIDTNDFEKALVEQQAKLEARHYKDTGILLHVFANKLRMSSAEIISDTAEEIKLEAANYINDLVKDENAYYHLKDDRFFRLSARDTSYKGLGYPDSAGDPISDDFRIIQRNVVEKFQAKAEKEFKDRVSIVFSDIATNIDLCKEALLSNSSAEYSDEFLQNLPKENIARQICALPNSMKYEFMLSIGGRLHNAQFTKPNETKWADQLGDLVIAYADQLPKLERKSARDFAQAFLKSKNAS